MTSARPIPLRLLSVLLLSLLLGACSDSDTPAEASSSEGSAGSGGAPRGDVLFDLGDVGEFELTDHLGRPFTRRDLDGKIWVVDFFFVNCPSFCPLLNQDLRRLASRYRNDEDVRFLSISVDPERDTPEALAMYAANYDADPEQWLFLTGDKRAIYTLAEEGFKVHVGDKEADGDIPHSDRFHVLDREGHLRSWTSKFNEEAVGNDFLDEVGHDIDLLLDGKGDPPPRNAGGRP